MQQTASDRLRFSPGSARTAYTQDRSKQMAHNEIEKLAITGFAFGGASFGKLDSGKICFVRGGVPGDLAEIQITASKKNFSTGRLLRILQKSEHRIQPVCPYALTEKNALHACPGCSYQQTDYETELQWKQIQFESFLLRSGLTDKDHIRTPFGAPSRFGWRNKLRFSCEVRGNQIQTGYMGEDNVSFLPIRRCLLSEQAIQDAHSHFLMSSSSNSNSSLQHRQSCRHVSFRWTPSDGVRIWTDADSGLSDTILHEQLGSFGTFQVPLKSFFQVNIPVASELVRRVSDTVQHHEIRFLADLYCGTGIFSIAAARENSELTCIGIELDPRAIDSARDNA